MTDEKNAYENILKPADIDAPWKRWKVKPLLEAMFADPPESGIGKRIAYCRGQLDGLSVDALARYTKFFDKDGISRPTIARYETGDNLPGARELRILSDTLWVPTSWLLLGKLETSTSTGFGQAVEDALNAHLGRLGVGGLQQMLSEANAGREAADIQQRQRWIDEARSPKPRT